MKLLAVALLLVLVAGPALGETETCLDFECPNEEMDGGKFAVSRFSCQMFVLPFCLFSTILLVLQNTKEVQTMTWMAENLR